MRRLVTRPAQTAALILRALGVMLALAAPVLAVPSMTGSPSTVIEAPSPQPKGVGFVILVSLQRR